MSPSESTHADLVCDVTTACAPPAGGGAAEDGLLLVVWRGGGSRRLALHALSARPGMQQSVPLSQA
eukprot:2243374-Prymnesium_polylepis.1